MAVEITSQLLIKLAGKAAYIRGQGVFESGQITHLNIKKNSILAEVEGTYPYKVRLKITPNLLDGTCSCPASDNFDFCKHCVAVALAYSSQKNILQDAQGKSEIERIQTYLQTLDKQTLSQHLLDIIENNSQEFNSWVVKADLALGTVDAREMRKKITKSLPYRSIWGYRQVGNYFIAAESIFAVIIEPIASLPAEDQFKLYQYGYQRLNKALEKIDDSNGDRYEIEGRLENGLTHAFLALNWPNKKKSEFLLSALKQSDDVFPEIPGKFIAEDDNALYKAFIVQCEELWLETVKTHTPDQFDYLLSVLKSILIKHAKEKNDPQREIDLLAATASYPHDYSELAEKHMALSQYDKAEQWLKKAQESSHHSQPTNLLSLQVKLETERGNLAIALEKQWELFKLKPSDHDYTKVKKLHQLNKLPEAQAYQQAESFLLEKSKSKSENYYEPPNTNLIEFYLYNQQVEKATEVADKEKVEAHLLCEIGLEVATSQPETAIRYHHRAASVVANQGRETAYQDAVSLLKKLKTALPKTAYSEFFDMVEQLKAIPALKREPNLMTLFDKHFSS